ncbi:aldo/keto reductase [Amylibacter sp.]|nr:aldo/keto reductase [Amylibacter sp.]MDA9178781.1 aldo/keto reductase [Amylibacter sp.]MDA9243446.1 aldo/keto reductase [Amylibacter sp.]MDA9290933.1 aldo/keto reductase [Amylibacter sp.]MDA9313657.1 aldo/keto reductase [Amylibacter sp.]
MKRIKINENIDFSQIIYGMWRLADGEINDAKSVTDKINLCLDQGITTFDQADIYGDYSAEALFGIALKEDKSLRNKIEIVTKCGIVAPCGKYADVPVKYYDTSKKHIDASVNASLKNMNIDYIDMLLIHRPDPYMDHNETGQALDTLIKSGKIGAVGVSNFKPHDWELLQSTMVNKLHTNQIELSLQSIDAFSNGDVAFHQKNASPIMAWSPLGGGKLMTESNQLTNKMDQIGTHYKVDRAAVAISFLLSHPANIIPIMGTNNIDRISKISDAFKVKMDRITWFELYTAALGREVA